jgi:hypothetical protein
MGLLVWGDETLHVTVGYSGFWDRRGGREFGTPLSYLELKDLLLTGKEQEVRAAFEVGGIGPYQLGGGRIEIGVRPVAARLVLEEGLLVVETADGENIEFLLSMEDDVCTVSFDRVPEDLDIQVRPTWDWVSEELLSRGVSAPHRWSDVSGSGFFQPLPEDDGLAVGIERTDDGWCIGTKLGDFEEGAFRGRLAGASPEGLRGEIAAWWRAFWSRLPEDAAEHEDPVVAQALKYSLWKLGALTPPNGVPATLQGPWVEEHRLPLWRNDYHFNINLEMIYWPCLHLGLGDHLRPLWTMVKGWFPQLRKNGERFFGVPGAMMLPHAVDDRCHPIGSFWQGTVDHASTAWIAQLAWLDYAHHNDPWVLEEIAWPLLVGAFEGFFAMLEDEGDRLRLPISVSPEYGEGAIGTWGANASFQLAAIHMLCRLLPQAAAARGVQVDPRWADVAARLPKYSLAPVPIGPYDDPNGAPRFRIALWEGQDLDHSHRHHSHLAGLYPFDSMDPEDEEVLRHSLLHWAYQGGGQWSAWGTAWAVCLMARAGWVDGARAWLRFLIDASKNEGGSLSAGGSRGCFISWGSAEIARRHAHEGDHEVMQLDANLGLITAVHEIKRALASPVD